MESCRYVTAVHKKVIYGKYTLTDYAAVRLYDSNIIYCSIETDKLILEPEKDTPLS